VLLLYIFFAPRLARTQRVGVSHWCACESSEVERTRGLSLLRAQSSRPSSGYRGVLPAFRNAGPPPMTASFASVFGEQGMPHSDWIYWAAALRRLKRSIFFANPLDNLCAIFASHLGRRASPSDVRQLSGCVTEMLATSGDTTLMSPVVVCRVGAKRA
jgi:hypothetical protein